MAVSDFGISSVRSQVRNFLVDHRIRLTVGTYLATIVLDLCLRKQWQAARHAFP